MITYGFALTPQDDSAAFSDAFHALVGDGVCEYGGKFGLTLADGFNLTLAPGFALAAGRWLKSDEPYAMRVPPSGNYADRYDAVAAVVDLQARRVSLEVLVDVALSELAMIPAVPLYRVHVRRGATVLRPEDITDVRTYVGRLDRLSADALRVYEFLRSGIDTEVTRILGLTQALIDRAQAEIDRLDAAIARKGRISTGDIETCRVRPTPEAAWLLCNGGPVPDGYDALRAMLGGALPDIAPADSRFSAYIYGGIPA